MGISSAGGSREAAVAGLISVILTTYKRENALDAVLRGLARQTDRNFEIIVADDGSDPATRNLVESRATGFDMVLKHVWHVDRGFRAGEVRNRGILASRGSYCVFLDGDCIPRPDFIAVHRDLAEPGWFVTGNRILMSRDLTERVLTDEGVAERWGWDVDCVAVAAKDQPARAVVAIAARPLAEIAGARPARRAPVQSRGLAERSRPRDGF